MVVVGDIWLRVLEVCELGLCSGTCVVVVVVVVVAAAAAAVLGLCAHRQQSVLAALHRPCQEVDGLSHVVGRIVARADRVVQIGERAICDGMVEPIRDRVDEKTSGAWGARGRRPHLPIALGVGMSIVERDAEDLRDLGIPLALHVVDALRDQSQVQQLVREDVIE